MGSIVTVNDELKRLGEGRIVIFQGIPLEGLKKGPRRLGLDITSLGRDSNQILFNTRQLQPQNLFGDCVIRFQSDVLLTLSNYETQPECSRLNVASTLKP
jgi:hypothetical protein